MELRGEHENQKTLRILEQVLGFLLKLIVDRFQQDESVRVLVANLIAGGVGLNLTRARQVVFNDLDWVPANHLQAEDRCHRIGFLFSGHLLQVGPPKKMSEQLGIQIVELEVAEGDLAARLLEQDPAVFEVSHFGNVLRVATLKEDPESVCRRVLDGQVNIEGLLPARSTIEDVFVAKVRERDAQERA